MIDKDTLQLDRPRRTPDHPTKSHVVKTMVDGSEKIIRFGEQGASTAGKPKEGESDAMKAKRASFKARHGANIAKGKSSPAYWADKVKWADGGSVSLNDLDQKYEGIKKPDFENLRALNELIRTLQQNSEAAAQQEFDPVAATIRSAPRARSLDELAAAYADKPMVSHARRAEAGAVTPISEDTPYYNEIVAAAERNGVPPDLFLRLIRQESGFKADAVSPAGAQGLAQLMPGTAKDLGVLDPMDPLQNLEGGARYLGDLLGEFGDPALALAAYNAGPGRVKQYGGIPPIEETQNYVKAILGDSGVTGYKKGGSVGSSDRDRQNAPKTAEPMYAVPPPAESWGKGTSPKRERSFGSLALEMADPYLVEAYNALTRAPVVDPNSYVPESIQRINQTLGNTGSAALSALAGLGYGGAGLAGDVADATGLGGGSRLSNDLAAMIDVAGVVPEGRILAALADAGAARDVGRTVVERANQRGPVPTMGSNFGNVPRERNVSIPDLRTMYVDDAIAAARLEPHLIDAGNRSEGLYLGGPRTIQSKEDLDVMRKYLDDYIAADPRGGDWYDRYRAGVNEVTGGDPRDNLWMTNLEGQYSAGVSPEGELGFSLKDTNRMIATGDPGKPARPAQAAASLRAALSNDPTAFQLGPKTGEYAKLVDPSRQGMSTATGVNDFRHLRNLGYTEASGEAQRNAVGAAGHRFADYETALAVGRANDASLAGRSNWTGEQLQAAPWVRQKALDFLDRGRAPYNEKARKMLESLGQDVTESSIDAMAYELAFQDANRTIADFFPKHTAFATHEAQPYRYGDHLSGLADAPAEVKIAYAQDPRSTWAIAPGGRDAIYSGLRYGDTGYAMRVRPTTGMQGVYEAPGNVLEYNLGEVARPLVSFDSGDVKSVAEADQSLLNMGEALRGYVDYQGATPWHKVWEGGKTGLSNSVFATKKSAAPASPEDISKLKALGEKYGLPDVIDTGEGVTFTNFMDDNFKLDSKTAKNLFREIDDFGKFKTASRVKVDSGYPGYEGTWEQGAGSGAATRQLFEYLDAAPAQALIALDQNPMIPKVALNRLARDKDYAAQYGVAREDLTNAREIIGSGPGWVGRLRKALAAGAILPGIGFALLSQPEPENAQ